MKNKKSGFFTFICSLVPGAGEMYMGFFKQGLSLMGLFLLICVASSFYAFERLVLFLPLIWFYSFFHVHHLRSLPPEEFYSIEDQFLLLPNQISSCTKNLAKRRKLIAIVLIVFGVSQLCEVLINMLSWLLPDDLYDYVWRMQTIVPRLIIGVVIVYAGLRMIQGSKNKEMLYAEDEDEYDEDEEGVEEDDPEQ